MGSGARRDADGAHAASTAPPMSIASTPTATATTTANALQVIPAGATTGIGSLPHRNARQAVEFAFEHYDVPTIPSLPRRSPAESSVAQALVGTRGVTLGPYGTVAVDPARLDPTAPVATDLAGGDHFGGFRAFLDAAVSRSYAGPVKWQFVGPISVGVALLRAGAAPATAFAVAQRTVRSHLQTLSAAVAAAMPSSPQLVVLDEPFADGLMSRDFPWSPDEAVDVLSAAMAAVEPHAAVGVHCCGDVDIATLLESGPHVLSLPVSTSLVPLAGYLDRFLANGGWIAWGAIATAGPIGVTANRSWHLLASLWCELVQRGCDPDRLREQCLLTPECGLGTHSPVVAERVCRALRDVSRSVRSEAAAAKFILGA